MAIKQQMIPQEEAVSASVFGFARERQQMCGSP
jgi:hypothetical protein